MLSALKSGVFFGRPPVVGAPAPGDSVYLWTGNYTGLNLAERYRLGDNTVVAATALNTQYVQAWASCTNTSAARLDGGEDLLTASKKYTYASEATSAGATLGVGAYDRTGWQSSSVGYFTGGVDFVWPQQLTGVTDKITFASDTRSAGTALSTKRRTAAAAGNSTRAIFTCGFLANNVPTATSGKYTFSGDTLSGATALSVARERIGAAGNTTRAIFGGGFSGSPLSSTEKYTYSSDARVAATALGTARSDLRAAGNNTVGLFHGGSDAFGGRLNVTDRYTYADDTRTSGTSLGNAVADHASSCDAAGGL